jgi:hypothetical protein
MYNAEGREGTIGVGTASTESRPDRCPAEPEARTSAALPGIATDK